MALGKRGKARMCTCLGAGAFATVLAHTHAHNAHSNAPELPDVKNTHTSWPAATAADPEKRTVVQNVGHPRWTVGLKMVLRLFEVGPTKLLAPATAPSTPREAPKRVPAAADCMPPQETAGGASSPFSLTVRF